jgi:hypothetical protein
MRRNAITVTVRRPLFEHIALRDDLDASPDPPDVAGRRYPGRRLTLRGRDQSCLIREHDDLHAVTQSELGEDASDV